jgi:hypothetical protein
LNEFDGELASKYQFRATGKKDSKMPGKKGSVRPGIY